MIDEKVLERQQGHGSRREVKCRQCGKRTMDRGGTCTECRRAGVMNFPKRSTEALIGMLVSIRRELERRQIEAQAAVEMAANVCSGLAQETERDG